MKTLASSSTELALLSCTDVVQRLLRKSSYSILTGNTQIILLQVQLLTIAVKATEIRIWM